MTQVSLMDSSLSVARWCVHCCKGNTASQWKWQCVARWCVHCCKGNTASQWKWQFWSVRT